jgi:hypothetical protein
MDKTLFVLPVVPERDYDAFRRDVGPNLPDTYNEWRKIFLHDLANAVRQGKNIVEVEVHYDEFMAHCATNGLKHNAQALLDLAERKRASRQPK